MVSLLRFVYSINYVVITIYHSQIKQSPGIATAKAYSNDFEATSRIHTIPTDINWQTTTLRLPSYKPYHSSVFDCTDIIFVAIKTIVFHFTNFLFHNDSTELPTHWLLWYIRNWYNTRRMFHWLLLLVANCILSKGPSLGLTIGHYMKHSHSATHPSPFVNDWA